MKLSTKHYTVVVTEDAGPVVRVDWNALVTRQWGAFIRIVRDVLSGWGDPDIEECAQDAILRVLEQSGKYRPRTSACGSPEKWASRVVRNHALNFARAACRSRVHVDAGDLVADECETSLPSYVTKRRMAQARIKHALASLNESARKAATALGDAEGNGKVAAKAIGVSGATMSRRRKELAAALSALA